MSEATAQPLRRSVWTRKQKLIRLIWDTVGRVPWALLPGARPSLIRLFGGKVGSGCALARSTVITIPWNLVIGDNVRVCERVQLYSLGTITIGDGVCIDTRAHLCAGSHDFTDIRFPLTRPTITVGRETMIGIDAFIGPGVTIGERCRVAPRASVYSDFGDGVELIGNPAKPAPPEAAHSA